MDRHQHKAQMSQLELKSRPSYQLSLSSKLQKLVSDFKLIPDFIKLENEAGTSEDMHYSICTTLFPSEFKVVAEKDLNETEGNKTKGMKKLREFLKRENLPDVDDCTLILVLRNCKYNIKKSEVRLKNFLKAVRMLLENVTDLDLKKVEQIIEDKGIGVLPYRDKNGRVIVFTQPHFMKEDSYSKDYVMVTAVALILVLLLYPMTSVAGIAYIGGCKYTSISSYLSLLKSYRKYVWTFLDLPLRIGRIELTNEHFFTRWFLNLIRPFLSSKLFNRITFHGSNLQILQEMYHPDILPEEFGGNMGPYDPTFYKDFAMKCLEVLIEEGQALQDVTK